jgi:hypothetical protein
MFMLLWSGRWFDISKKSRCFSMTPSPLTHLALEADGNRISRQHNVHHLVGRVLHAPFIQSRLDGILASHWLREAQR